MGWISIGVTLADWVHLLSHVYKRGHLAVLPKPIGALCDVCKDVMLNRSVSLNKMKEI